MQMNLETGRTGFGTYTASIRVLISFGKGHYSYIYQLSVWATGHSGMAFSFGIRLIDCERQ